MIFEYILFYLFFTISVFYSLFALDDLFIDIYAWIKRIGLKPLPQNSWLEIQNTTEKRIGILIASWKEADVLPDMIEGNLSQIRYHNFTILLGVYPNDTETLKAANRLAEKHELIKVIVNEKDGPTSKGQMLNYMVDKVVHSPASIGSILDAVIIHDAEDIIHPDSLKLINWKLEKNDFIQIPIFSLPVELNQFVAGTYVDEFAESHGKDMMVRQQLGAPIPSAGVGTGLSRKLLQTALIQQGGHLLINESVTEDYLLGLSTKKWNLKSSFAGYYLIGKDQSYNFIATREYFPKNFRASVRQRSRWVLGIAFQGWKYLGWTRNIAENYFLFRDRKAPLSNIVNLIGTLFFISLGLSYLFTPDELLAEIDFLLLRAPIPKSLLLGIPGLNIVFLLNRVFQRMRYTTSIYGFKMAIPALIRLVLGNVINILASARAAFQFFQSERTGKAPKWLKTDHENPFQKQLPELKTQSSKKA